MQNNLRVVTENVADEYLTLTTTTESGVLVATNLVNDLKSKVWRGTTLTETITVTWDSPQAINMVALPFLILSKTSFCKTASRSTSFSSLFIYFLSGNATKRPELVTKTA